MIFNSIFNKIQSPYPIIMWVFVSFLIISISLNMIFFDTLTIRYTNCKSIDYSKYEFLKHFLDLKQNKMIYTLESNYKFLGINKFSIYQDINGCFNNNITFSAKTLKGRYFEGICLINYYDSFQYLNQNFITGVILEEEFLFSKVSSCDIKLDINFDSKDIDDLFSALVSLPFSEKLMIEYKGCKTKGRTVYIKFRSKPNQKVLTIYEKDKEICLPKNNDLFGLIENKPKNLLRFELSLSNKDQIQEYLQLPVVHTFYCLYDLLNCNASPITHFFEKHLLSINSKKSKMNTINELNIEELSYVNNLIEKHNSSLQSVRDELFLYVGKNKFYRKYKPFLDSYSKGRINRNNIMTFVYDKIVKEESLNYFLHPSSKISNNNLRRAMNI